jgi:hypothetical protein
MNEARALQQLEVPPTCVMEAKIAEDVHDSSEVMSRLKRSTTKVRRYQWISFIALGTWSIVWFTRKSGTWEGEVVAGVVTVVVLVVGFVAQWRLRWDQSGEEQKRAVEDLCAIAKADPTTLEPVLQDLKRFTRRWSPTYEQNISLRGKWSNEWSRRGPRHVDSRFRTSARK